MMHPHSELRFVSPTVGHGVFATAPIPRGTIVYVQDALEILLPANDPRLQQPAYRPILDKYCVINPDGTRLLSWDIARFVNHSCRPNTLSTGYGFEIALRDIAPGEEITDDYGLFNLPYEMACACGQPACRGAVRPADFSWLVAHWDRLAGAALRQVDQVPQPLWPFLDEATRQAVHEDAAHGRRPSVAVLALTPAPAPATSI